MAKSNNSVKKNKPSKQKLAVRIVCLVLAALMVGGGIISIVMYLTAGWSYAKAYSYKDPQLEIAAVSCYID